MDMRPRKQYKQFLRNLKPYVRPDFFYINIGANDGVSNDPVFPFIERYGWKGLQVEPLPHNFKKLKRNLAAWPQTLFECVAVVTNVGEGGTERLMHHFPGDLIDSCYLLGQISSLDPNELAYTLQELRDAPGHIEELDTIPIPIVDAHQCVQSTPVSCMTFSQLLEKHGITSFDFLNVDAEGYDYEIVMSADIPKFLPSVICIETIHFSQIQREKFLSLMDECGYVHIQRFEYFSDIYARQSC